ncbi:MAG: UPF0280 family protein [Burkholderiales bacterium]|nr:UPF0280 family protein [Burkholderiales bacterium]
MPGPQRHRLGPARERWCHGPIDLVVAAWGEADAVEAAFGAAWARFGGVLDALVAELALLRRPVTPTTEAHGPVARRMVAACRAHLPAFVTPMAAVAGAVAEDVLEHFVRDGVARALVNNGGDIALHLAPGQVLRVGIVPDPRVPAVGGCVAVAHEDAVRGIATSGWRGRSFSLGIADSVTVLARTAAAADAAATLIANAVNVEHPAVQRAPASSLKDDSDLGERLVTTAVGALPARLVETALVRGLEAAERQVACGNVIGAALALQGQWRATAAAGGRIGGIGSASGPSARAA